jgi:hypothetical protein
MQKLSGINLRKFLMDGTEECSWQLKEASIDNAIGK